MEGTARAVNAVADIGVVPQEQLLVHIKGIMNCGQEDLLHAIISASETRPISAKNALLQKVSSKNFDAEHDGSQEQLVHVLGHDTKLSGLDEAVECK